MFDSDAALITYRDTMSPHERRLALLQAAEDRGFWTYLLWEPGPPISFYAIEIGDELFQLTSDNVDRLFDEYLLRPQEPGAFTMMEGRPLIDALRRLR